MFVTQDGSLTRILRASLDFIVRNRGSSLVIFALVALGAVFLGQGIYEASPEGRAEAARDAQEAAAKEQQREDDVPITVAKALVQGTLRDPDSAQFIGIHLVRRGKDEPIVCGYVNGNNAFGGKAGYEMFMVNGTHVAFAATSDDFATIERTCGG